ncbi:outer dynein arm-docking complex subunit 4 [Neocloeon triangulifer]|uniref:outer dynein arm-docking complex subunit 4 n=1 Tax=Neocloeon triangulifer TaxID=2078957 RepID=UPI00286EBC1B|nr:outer dynein arm-docking complex subunit 4 [Neocloeon triangulifer]
MGVPRGTKNQNQPKVVPKPTKQQRAAMREEQAAQAESRVRYDEATNQLKNGNYQKALDGLERALELQPHDKHALVARSKCHLLLGLAQEALQDANAALAYDKHFVKAIFQKAEALYHLGDFEHSLMFYHRGQRLRPEQAGFRLGVQKAQEAIENAIGSCRDKLALLSSKYAGDLDEKNQNKSNSPASEEERSETKENNNLKPATPLRTKSAASGTAKSTPSSGKSRTSSSTASKQPRKKQHLLGQLSVDREYLENLLQHPG